MATDRLLTLLITGDATVLVLPQMEVSAVQPRHGEVVLGWEDADGPAGALEQAFSRLGPISSAAFEEWLPYRSVAALAPHLPLSAVRPAGDILARPRLVKSQTELAGMAVAAGLGGTGAHALPSPRPARVTPAGGRHPRAAAAGEEPNRACRYGGRGGLGRHGRRCRACSRTCRDDRARAGRRDRP